MKPNWILCDDGTMDTVFRCNRCGDYQSFNFAEHHADVEIQEGPLDNSPISDAMAYNQFVDECAELLESEGCWNCADREEAAKEYAALHHGAQATSGDTVAWEAAKARFLAAW